VTSVCAAGAHTRGKMVIDAVWHEELRVLGPSIVAFGKTDLFFAKRLAMRIGCVLPVRRTVTNMAVENDEGRSTLCLSEGLEGALDAIGIVGITNPENIPSIT